MLLLTVDYSSLNRVHGTYVYCHAAKDPKLIGGLPCIAQMTQKILEAEGEGDSVQLDFFLKGNLALEKNSRRKPHSWLPDQVRHLSQLNPSPELSATVLDIVQAPKVHQCCIYVRVLTNHLAWHVAMSSLPAPLSLLDCSYTCSARLLIGLLSEGCTTRLQGWEDVMRLVEIGKTKEGSPLATLADDIERNEVAWKEWAALEAPEAALMPADLTAKLSLFEQLLVSPDTLLYLAGICSA